MLAPAPDHSARETPPNAYRWVGGWARLGTFLTLVFSIMNEASLRPAPPRLYRALEFYLRPTDEGSAAGPQTDAAIGERGASAP